MSETLTEGYFKGEFNAGQFEKWWPGGYRCNRFHNRGYDENKIMSIVNQYSNEVGLEIGPGGGFWTQKLVKKFKNLICVDVIAKPDKVPGIVQWIRADKNNQYDLPGIKEDSIDFVFSFDTFCHFGLRARDRYLESISRVLKPQGVGLIMFANWQNGRMGGARQSSHAKDDYLQYPEGGWFYDDLEITTELLTKNNLEIIKNHFPDSRDNVISFKKMEQ